jgi:hypothetical protein
MATNYVFGGDPIMAADMNRAINKKQAENVAVTDTGSIAGTETQVDTVTADLVAGRSYKVRWFVPYASTTTTGNSSYLARIRQGSGTGGTQLSYTRLDTPAATRVQTKYVEANFTASSTGAQTFTGTVQRDTGTDTVNLKGATSQPRLLGVYADD